VLDLVLLIILVYFLVHGLFTAIVAEPVEPPKLVRAVALAEGVFALLVLSLLWFVSFEDKLLVKLILVFSFSWICVAVSIFRGSRIGRVICLILSILRIVTVVGIPFSILATYGLYFNDSSNDFFKK
jgi:hypothetical protein